VRPGPETFLGEPRGNVVAFSRAVVRAGADLVVGHGPHVLRGIEWYRGRVIAYSLGNFLGNGTLNVSGVSGQTAVLRASLRRDGSWAGGKLVPVRLTPGGLPRVDARKAALATVRKLSRADFGRNAVRISPSGTLLPPAWRTG
jgi:poly-gamma-glutamate capsule biosynthesis protein CapA/YwtB (metallophosphatase superfamily)